MFNVEFYGNFQNSCIEQNYWLSTCGYKIINHVRLTALSLNISTLIFGASNFSIRNEIYHRLKRTILDGWFLFKCASK